MKLSSLLFTAGYLELVVGCNPEYFYGVDIAPQSSTTNSDTEASAFSSRITDIQQESFETFPIGNQNSLGLSTFTNAGMAVLSAQGFSLEIRSDSDFGRFPVEGTQFLEVNAGDDFKVNLQNDVAAFGFYGTDIGDFSGQLFIKTLKDGIELTSFEITGGSNANLLFFGVIDQTCPFDEVKFDTSFGEDVLGFDLLTIASIEQIVDPTDPGTLPDPHFKTFGNVWYDFHGGCDLVLVDIPNFGFGAGLTVHIRTTVRYAYSFIGTAAIKIGDDILQVSSFGQYSLNGVSDVDMPNVISGYVVEHTVPSNDRHQFYVDLHDGRHFTVKVFKDMVSFSFHLPGNDEEFGEVVGLLGHWKSGARIGRDGVTVISDPNEFGQEWQVRNTDPKLFMADQEPQFPAKCIMPDPVERASRRLEATVSTDAAAMACAHIQDEQIRDMCIFDVISTDDISVAQSGVY